MDAEKREPAQIRAKIDFLISFWQRFACRGRFGRELLGVASQINEKRKITVAPIRRAACDS